MQEQPTTISLSATSPDSAPSSQTQRDDEDEDEEPKRRRRLRRGAPLKPVVILDDSDDSDDQLVSSPAKRRKPNPSDDVPQTPRRDSDQDKLDIEEDLEDLQDSGSYITLVHGSS